MAAADLCEKCMLLEEHNRDDLDALESDIDDLLSERGLHDEYHGVARVIPRAGDGVPVLAISVRDQKGDDLVSAAYPIPTTVPSKRSFEDWLKDWAAIPWSEEVNDMLDEVVR